MSLKAKIEAVIYASEEPVTLAQLTGLLGEEGQLELDAIAAQQHTLALEAEAAPIAAPGTALDPEALNDEILVTEVDAAEVIDFGDRAPEASVAEAAAEAIEEPAPPADPATTPEAPKPTEADQKLTARKLRDYFRSVLDQLIADYANGDRGLEIREVAGGFRLATKPEYHDAVRGFVKSLKPPLKLTLQALETLAVVAYKQPVTAPEVSEIRGVDSGGVLGSLLGRKLVTTAGRKQVIGRPILYKTTKDFLLRFGLKDINELPSIEEFEKMAGELNDAVQEEIQMEHPSEPTAATSEAAETDPIELEGHNLQPIESPQPTEDHEPEDTPEPAQTSVILSEGESSEPQPKDPEATDRATTAKPLSHEEAPTTEPDAPTSEPESISETGNEPEPNPEA